MANPVRVRTSAGWQDLAIPGAPGPPAAGGVLIATTAVTPAQMLTLHTTPVPIVPGVPNKVIGLVGLGFTFKWGGVAYPQDAIEIYLGYGTTKALMTSSSFLTQPFGKSGLFGFTQRTGDGYVPMELLSLGNELGAKVWTASQVLGQPVSIVNNAAAYTSGNSTLIFNTLHFLIDA